jgi:hypothetical protein
MIAAFRTEKTGALLLPTLEDANSIQVALADVIRMLRTQEVDHRTAALMLYAMQTASSNLKHTSFEPEPTQVVIDRDCLERRPIAATAWSKVKGREYDEFGVEKDDDDAINSAARRLLLEKFRPRWLDMVKGREASSPEESVDG